MRAGGDDGVGVGGGGDGDGGDGDGDGDGGGSNGGEDGSNGGGGGLANPLQRNVTFVPVAGCESPMAAFKKSPVLSGNPCMLNVVSKQPAHVKLRICGPKLPSAETKVAISCTVAMGRLSAVAAAPHSETVKMSM